MDPYLKAILDSGMRPDQLLAPERDPRAGLDQRAVNDPLLARRRFAATTPQEARQNAYATALDEPAAAAKNLAQMILQLFGRGSLETQDRMHRELETAGQAPNKWTWDDAALALDATPMAPVVGILAGGRGAQKVGGRVLERFLAGREAAQTPGAGAQKLWREHGYDPGVDRLGRWEISDVASEVVAGGPHYKGPVGQALKHEDLYAAYPELKDMPLDMRINAELAASGSYNPRTGRLAVRAPSVEEARSVLLHELQHPVQQMEGHPGGTNLSGGLEKYLREAGEVEAANVQTRLADPDLMKFAPEMTERVPRIEQLISQDPQAVMLSVIKGPWPDRIKKDVLRELQAQYPRLEKLAEQTFKTAKLPALPEQLPDVIPLAKTRATQPKIVEMLGQEEARYGADVYLQGQYPFNVGGVAREYESEELARKAALRFFLAQEAKRGREYKPVKPQISEFASPENARKSWRLLSREDK